MSKKVYNAPYMKVVQVKNDIIATSVGTNDTQGNGIQLIQGRGAWDDTEEDW